MTIDLAAMIFIGGLILWQLWWRTHVPLVIYATCAGFVLTTTWGAELIAQLSRIWPPAGTETGQTSITLALFLIPPLVTAWQFRHTMGRRIIQQFAPAVFWSFFLVAFILRLLPIGTQQKLLQDSYILGQINTYASWTVLLAISIASIELLSQHDLLRTRSRRKHHHGRDE